jgi:predicted permease
MADELHLLLSTPRLEHVPMHSLFRDCRFAIRQLRKNPGFTLITVLTLALGIGATTSIFSLVNTIILRPLPFADQDRLMSVAEGGQRGPGEPIKPGSFSYPNYFDYRNQSKTFEDIASYRDQDSTLITDRGPQHLTTQVVAANFFRVLRVAPIKGRDFNWNDEKPRANVVMLSYATWQEQFGGVENIVGGKINLDGAPYTVVGVMPARFEFPIKYPAPAMYLTLAVDAYDPAGGEPATIQRGAHFLRAIGRLKPGVTVDQGRAELSLIAANLKSQYPDTNTHFPSAVVRTLIESMVGKTRPAFRLLFGAVSFVLLIACVNVAGLMLARGSQRRAEIAIRSAVGASRWEIVRQVLIESIVLSLLGGALGVLFSSATLSALVRLIPQELPRLSQVSVDGTAVAFAVGVSIITGVLFGALPAWRMSNAQPAQSIRQGSRSVTMDRTQHRLQNGLVIAETAVGLVLLVGSALLIHSFVRVLRVNPGFDPHNVVTTEIGLSDPKYDAPKVTQFYEQLLEKVKNIPGVTAVAGASPLPLSNSIMRISFEIDGRPVTKGTEPSENIASITPDYFSVMRIPLVRGRLFTSADRAKAPLTLIVTQKFADRYFPNEDPIGKRIRPGLSDGQTKDDYREIVGVVGDVKMEGLTSEFEPQYYLPYPQAVIGAVSLAIRTEGNPLSVIGQVREAVHSLDQAVPLYDIHTLESNVSRSAAQARFQATLLTSFAGMALLLFAVGLYAVLSYTVSQRTVEIGLRMALGARREDMLRRYLFHGLRLTAMGGIIGLIAAAAMTRLLASMLYEVKATDGPAFISVSVVVIVVAITASFMPARRAMTVNPMSALKDE